MKVLPLALIAVCSKPAPLPFDEIAIPTPPGISDVTVDDKGTIWVIPERDREIDEVTLNGNEVTRHPLDGIAEGDDTEAVAWLGDRFAIGTEGGNTPTAAVVFAERRGDRIVVTGTRKLSSDELGVALTMNQGVEGLCGHGNEVIAAIESTGRQTDGARYSPIAWLSGDKIAVTRLHLTTETGKISAITCTFTGNVAHVLAIERHFSVSRIVQFDLTRGAAEVTPTVFLDLGPILNSRLNLEGLARLPDGRLIAVHDNQSKTVTGPSELLVFH